MRGYWRGIVTILVAAVLVAFVWTLTQPKIYEASSSGLVAASGATNLGLATAGDTLAKSKATSYASIASTRPVAEAVKDELGLTTSENQLLNDVSVQVPADTAEIRVSALSEDPAQAQEIANAWVQVLAEEAAQIEAGEDEASPVLVRLMPLGRAALPTAPVSPDTRLALAIGAVAGLAAGLGYALIRHHLDRRIRSVDAVNRLGQSVVGTIPADERLGADRQIVDSGNAKTRDRAAHAFAESLRELRTNLAYMDVDHPPKIMVVTSSVPGEGKSSIASNLAVAIAATGRRTVLIDADLRRPVLTDLFGLPSGAGLTDVLSGAAEIDDVLMPYANAPALELLGSGRVPPNPSELLGSNAMKSLLQELAQDAVVLIDAPPLLPVTDAAILAKSADGALVTIKAGKTTIDELEKSLQNLNKVGAHVLGTILNQVPTSGADSAQYGYYGQYYYYASSDDSASSAAGPDAPSPGAHRSTAPDSASSPAPPQPAVAAVGAPMSRRARRANSAD
nr:polysaccharide biosynthesis tyrosine autokinase [Zhihengliuella flava]